jgi:uncharacterized repeat protein (TIGR03806 family)
MKIHTYTILLLSIILSACGGGSGSTDTVATSTDTDSATLNRTPVTSLNFPNTPAASGGDIEWVRAFPQLSFFAPVFLTQAAGDSRIFVLEQSGKIYAFANSDSAAQKQVFLDLSEKVSFGGEEGLLGLAFDPGYLSTNRYFYVYYSAADPRRSVVARYTMQNGEPPVADPGSEKILLEIPQPYSNHNAGMLAFGPDNMLYIALGDGGSGGDPLGHGQNTDTLLGSILRIDPHGGDPYAIPTDNPFVNGGGRAEIWAYGLRNPYRFSFDRDNGDLWTGDVGQNSREEIDIITRGGNYGWNVYEGNLNYDNPNNLPGSNFIAPVIDYGRGEGASVIGGYVYRGAAMPNLQGAYIYGDYVSGNTWLLRYSNGTVKENTRFGAVSNLTSFGEDVEGNIYALSAHGEIYRLQTSAAQMSQNFPQRLSETGIFTDLSTLQAADGILEYEVNAPLWSDNAGKKRWLAVPGTRQIDFAAETPWTFPLGTVLVKHFELDMTTGDPLSARRLETRIMLNTSAGWETYTYKWNAAQTDAELIEGGLIEVFSVNDASVASGTRQQAYYYPSRSDCLRCHTQAAGRALGVNTRQLNRNMVYSDGNDNQLRRFNQLGLFSQDIGTPVQYAALPNPANSDAPLGQRARAYLDINCAICHQPGGGTPATMDLRYHTPLDAANIINARPTQMGGMMGNATLVTPGAAQNSILWRRINTLGPMRMPPVGSLVRDVQGSALIQRWINNGAAE